MVCITARQKMAELVMSANLMQATIMILKSAELILMQTETVQKIFITTTQRSKLRIQIKTAETKPSIYTTMVRLTQAARQQTGADTTDWT